MVLFKKDILCQVLWLAFVDLAHMKEMDHYSLLSRKLVYRVSTESEFRYDWFWRVLKYHLSRSNKTLEKRILHCSFSAYLYIYQEDLIFGGCTYCQITICKKIPHSIWYNHTLELSCLFLTLENLHKFESFWCQISDPRHCL